MVIAIREKVSFVFSLLLVKTWQDSQFCFAQRIIINCSRNHDVYIKFPACNSHFDTNFATQCAIFTRKSYNPLFNPE